MQSCGSITCNLNLGSFLPDSVTALPVWAGGAAGRASRGHSSSIPQPCHLGMDSHIPSASGVLPVLRLHRMMTFGFRQISFPLRHGAGCFLSVKGEVHYVYGDTVEPLASLVPA